MDAVNFCMKTVVHIFILSLFIFATHLNANSIESEWVSPWETFEQAFPSNLSLVRRISIEESWNRGFEELEKYTLLHKEWTTENDRMLFEKIQEIMTKFSSEISLERIPQLKLYMQNRIKLYSSALPENVIQSYYFYLDFFPDDKRIGSLFQESFLKLNPDRAFSSDSEVQLLTYLIQDLIDQNKEIPLNYFKMLLSYCESLSFESKFKQKALLLLNSLFEIKEEQLAQVSIQDWDNLLVRRNSLFKSFRKNKISEQINNLIKVASETNLYLQSIILQNKLWDYQLIQNSPNSNIKLSWNSPEIQKFTETVSSTIRNQFSSTRPKETYQLLFSQVEILRTLLDLKISLDAQNSSVITKAKWEDGKLKKNQEERWYQKLKEFHNQAIGILQLTQYTTSLIFQCYQQNSSTKTCQTFRDYLPLTKTNNTSDWSINAPHIYFPPGRYEFEPNSNIFIKGEKIEFHPLAFIYAPSGTVNIEALEVNSPWIDVSGKEEVQIPHVISSGKHPWIKDAKHCHNRQYIEGATLVAIPKKTCENKNSIDTNLCGIKPEWTLFTVKNPYPNVPVCASNALDSNKSLVGDITKMLDLGQAPEEPSSKNWINETNGSKGGTISLTVQDQLTNPLLIAQGANGISGINGQSSPLCNSENEFTSYRIVVSQSQDEYTRWIEATKSNPLIRITPLQSEVYHHIGLLEVFIPRTSGSDGGSGGEGGQIKLNLPTKFSKHPWKLKSYFVGGGTEGVGGVAGLCGPNESTDGKMGLRGADGQAIVTKNSL
jgi:hypothetical protein